MSKIFPSKGCKISVPDTKCFPAGLGPSPDSHHFGTGEKKGDRKGLAMLHRVTSVIQLVACATNMATAKM